MKKQIIAIFSLAIVSVFSTGCGPQPVVEERVQEQPAVEVDVKPDTTDENTGVKVEVGGGQGIQVETGQSE
jgi:hypothetical protein